MRNFRRSLRQLRHRFWGRSTREQVPSTEQAMIPMATEALKAFGNMLEKEGQITMSSKDKSYWQIWATIPFPALCS